MNSYIHEKSQPVPIKRVSSFEKYTEVSLTPTLIDPSKMSPPNNFMDKLMKRMDNYYSPTENNSKNKSFSFKN